MIEAIMAYKLTLSSLTAHYQAITTLKDLKHSSSVSMRKTTKKKLEMSLMLCKLGKNLSPWVVGPLPTLKMSCMTQKLHKIVYWDRLNI